MNIVYCNYVFGVWTSSERENRLKPGLHIVVTIGEHACDHVLERVLKLSAYRSEIFLVKYQYLPSLQLCEGQDIHGKLKVPMERNFGLSFYCLT